MRHIGDFRIDDYIILGEQLHRFSSGAVYAPTGNVTYTIYENNSTNGPDGNAAAAQNLAQLNSKTGLYTARVQLTAAAGYEAGKDYIVHYEGTVDGVAAGFVEWFRIVGTTEINSSVTTDGGNSATAFKTNLSSATDDYYKDMLLVITSGALIGQIKQVSAYNGTSKIITVRGSFTGTPADDVTFTLINQ